MSVSNVGAGPSDLLALLRRQILSSDSSPTSSASSSGTADNCAQAQGGADPQNSADTASSAATGSNAPPFSPASFAIIISFQEQQAGASSDTAPGASDVSQIGAAGSSGLSQLLFQKLDTDGDGTISQSELESAASAAGGSASQADQLFSKLDADGNGSVSQSELTQALQQGHHHGHHHAYVENANGAGTDTAGGNSGASDPLAALLGSASSPSGTSAASASAGGSSIFDIGTDATSGAAGTAGGDQSASAGQQAQSPASVLATLIQLREQQFQSFASVDPAALAA